MKITNVAGINLPLAVWLLHDEYDYINEPNYISATSLLKPIKQAILASRIPVEDRDIDVQDFIASALGRAIHDSIEKAWQKGHKTALKKLGYPDQVINSILINPTTEHLAEVPNAIPVYMEQRAIREINGFKIGGKFDMVADGTPFDHKSTSAFTWVYGTRDEDHQLQLSIYRWLNPKKVTGDHGTINYIFTDWSRMSARTNPKYPQKRVEAKDIPLLSIPETERWLIDRTNLLRKHWNDPEEKIPECSEKELWMSDPVYKYYGDPTKTSGRSTKNFDNNPDAQQFMASKGGKGVVIKVPGEAKACNYCMAFDHCKQKDRYL